MDRFEIEDATEWQVVSSKKKKKRAEPQPQRPRESQVPSRPQLVRYFDKQETSTAPNHPLGATSMLVQNPANAKMDHNRHNNKEGSSSPMPSTENTKTQVIGNIEHALTDTSNVSNHQTNHGLSFWMAPLIPTTTQPTKAVGQTLRPDFVNPTQLTSNKDDTGCLIDLRSEESPVWPTPPTNFNQLNELDAHDKALGLITLHNTSHRTTTLAYGTSISVERAHQLAPESFFGSGPSGARSSRPALLDYDVPPLIDIEDNSELGTMVHHQAMSGVAPRFDGGSDISKSSAARDTQELRTEQESNRTLPLHITLKNSEQYSSARGSSANYNGALDHQLSGTVLLDRMQRHMDYPAYQPAHGKYHYQSSGYSQIVKTPQVSSSNSPPSQKEHNRTRGPTITRTQFPRNADHRSIPRANNRASRKTRKVLGTERPVPVLATRTDNPATTAWRNRRSGVQKVFNMPEDINPLGGARRSSGSQALIPRVAEIGAITGVHIVPDFDKRARRPIFKIHGEPEATDAALRLLRTWTVQIKELKKSDNPRWAKSWAYDKKKEKRIIKRIMDEERRQTYRRAFEEGTAEPSHCKLFEWPSSLGYRPEQVLGPNLEALDATRMDCLCYITCERGPKRVVFKLQGDDEEKIAEALQRLSQIAPQIEAKGLELEQTFILDVPEPVVSIPAIKLFPYTKPITLATHQNDTPPGRGVTPKFIIPLSTHAHAAGISSLGSVAERLKDSVVETMSHLRYYRGALEMRLHLGTFVMTKYRATKDGAYPYTLFADMLGEYQLEAHVSEELGDKSLETHTLERCMQATHLLFPQDAQTLSLTAIKPVYAATFLIANPSGAGDLMLNVELSEHEGGGTQLNSKRWSMLSKGTDGSKKLLDSSIIDLENGLAWHLGLRCTEPVNEDSMSIDYQDFPASLRLDLQAAKAFETNQDFIIYRTSATKLLSVPIKSVRQKRSWRFNTKSGDWVLEVTKYDLTELENGEPTKRYEPRWSVNLWHNQWETLLGANSNIEIGRPVPWPEGNACSLFFPENRDYSAFSSNAKITARQDVSDDEDSDSEDEISKQEKNETDPGSKWNRKAHGEDDFPVTAFEQLLDLLRQLQGIISGK